MYTPADPPGQGITDQTRNIRANQTLLLDFYRSASLLLRSGTARAPGLSKSNQRALDTAGGGGGVEAEFDEDEQEELRMILESATPADSEEATSALPAPPPPPPPTTRGTVLLTLRTNAPYSSWLPAQLATKGPLLAPSILPSHTPKARLADQPTYRTVRSWEFEPDQWEGYEHRRTRGWEAGKSAGANEDLRLSARERLEKKKNGTLGGGGAEGRVSSEAKGQMRTWEFELVTREDRRNELDASRKRRRGAAVAGGKKRKAGGDPDLSE